MYMQYRVQCTNLIQIQTHTVTHTHTCTLTQTQTHHGCIISKNEAVCCVRVSECNVPLHVCVSSFVC